MCPTSSFDIDDITLKRIRHFRSIDTLLEGDPEAARTTLFFVPILDDTARLGIHG